MVTPNWRQLEEAIAQMSDDDKRLLIARVQRSLHDQSGRSPLDEGDVAREHKEACVVLRERLASLDRGEPGVPAEQVLADVRHRVGLGKD